MSADRLVGWADPNATIAAEVLGVHVNSYGCGAGGVSVHIFDDLVMVLLDQLELSDAEHVMVDHGHSTSVIEMRAAFESTIQPTFRAIVERATGRQVASFFSRTCIAPPYSVELYRLDPVAA